MTIMEMHNSVSKCHVEIQSCNASVREMNEKVGDQLSNLTLIVTSIQSALTEVLDNRGHCKVDMLRVDANEEFEAHAAIQHEKVTITAVSLNEEADRLPDVEKSSEIQQACTEVNPVSSGPVALSGRQTKQAVSIKNLALSPIGCSSPLSSNCCTSSPIYLPRSWPPSTRSHELEAGGGDGFVSERVLAHDSPLLSDTVQTFPQSSAQLQHIQSLLVLSPRAAHSAPCDVELNMQGDRSSQPKSRVADQISSEGSAGLEASVRMKQAYSALLDKLKKMVDNLTEQWHADILDAKSVFKPSECGVHNQEALLGELCSEPVLHQMLGTSEGTGPQCKVQQIKAWNEYGAHASVEQS